MHWTYDSCEPDADLEQGDFLAVTPELTNLLSEVHAHFTDEKYLGFLITTQSCDLVRRGRKPPKSPYISIAAIRSLRSTFPRLLAVECPPILPGLPIFPSSRESDARKLLSRIFNQNEAAMGLFYLHPDNGAGIGDACVAMLRVTVSFRVEHYQKLVRARKVRLTPAFQAKLGWLLGNLYGRAAAPDWGDQPGGEAALKVLIAEHLKEQVEGCGPTWIFDELVPAAKKMAEELSNKPSEDVQKCLEEYRPPPPIDTALIEIENTIRHVMGDQVGEEQLTKVCNRLRNNGRFTRNVLKSSS
jgi:hypothetical protein